MGKQDAANDRQQQEETVKEDWKEISLSSIDKGKLAALLDERIAAAARGLVLFIEKHKKLSKARARVKLNITLGWHVEEGYTVVGETETTVPKDPPKADFLAAIELKSGTPTLTVGNPGEQDELFTKVNPKTGEIIE